MDKAFREQLESRFHFEEWASPPADPSGSKVSVEGIAVAGLELGGWRAQRVEPFILAGASSASRSFWSGGGEDAEVLLRLDLIDAASEPTARELLLELLGEFQSPQVARQENPGAGDLAFTVPGGTMLLFTRGQVVVIVRNAGRRVGPVEDFAQLVNERLGKDTGGPRRAG